MVANPGTLKPPTQDTPEGDDPILVSPSRRMAPLPAALARRAALPPAANTADQTILDYAEFVLDQEAQYCQQ
jgi:hypothetical protein